MINSERETFFESLLTAVKWKYTEAEQLIIFEKLPHKVSAGQLLEKAVLKFGRKQPTGKQLINFAWDLVKKHKVEVKKQVFEGCNNCIDGYIKVPNLNAYIASEDDTVINPPDDLINLVHATMYPSREVCCTCTKSTPDIKQYLKRLLEIQYVDQKLYEFVYVGLYAYAKMWLSEKRFADFDSFDPYGIYGVYYEDGATLRLIDCKNYGYLISAEQTMNFRPKSKTMPKINKENTYNAKIYG